MTTTLVNSAEYAPQLEASVEGLKFNPKTGNYTYNRRQYEVISVVSVNDELEVNFQAVSDKVAKKYASVSFIEDCIIYDGFNDKAYDKQPYIRKTPRKRKTKEEIEQRKKDYQAKYYLERTKVKRAEAKRINPKPRHMFEYTCAICGKTYQSSCNRSKYCSPECYKVGKRETNKVYFETYKETESYKNFVARTNERRKQERREAKEKQNQEKDLTNS